MLKTDEHVSFEKTNYKTPYDCPLLLELEDIFGYMVTYKHPFNKGDIGYLIRKKKKLHQNKCRDCYRLPGNWQFQPEDVQHNSSRRQYNFEKSKKKGRLHVQDVIRNKIPLNCQGCRVLKLKQAVNTQVKTSRHVLKLKEENWDVWRDIQHGKGDLAVWTGKAMRWSLHETPLPDQIQPNGIDFTVDKILGVIGGSSLSKEKAFTEHAHLEELLPGDISGLPDGSEGWFFERGYFVVEWAEIVNIPHDAIGLLFPRSTLLRNGITIHTAVWDRGYYGKGRSGITFHAPCLLERGLRLAQMIFIGAKDDSSRYSGQYQEENINVEGKTPSD